MQNYISITLYTAWNIRHFNMKLFWYLTYQTIYNIYMLEVHIFAYICMFYAYFYIYLHLTAYIQIVYNYNACIWMKFVHNYTYSTYLTYLHITMFDIFDILSYAAACSHCCRRAASRDSAVQKGFPYGARLNGRFQEHPQRAMWWRSQASQSEVKGKGYSTVCSRNVCVLYLENSLDWRCCRHPPKLWECVYQYSSLPTLSTDVLRAMLPGVKINQITLHEGNGCTCELACQTLRLTTKSCRTGLWSTTHAVLDRSVDVADYPCDWGSGRQSKPPRHNLPGNHA